MKVQAICVLTAASLSFLACAWLLVNLCRLPSSVRNRLFPKQMRYLAMVDLFFVVSVLPVMLQEEHVLDLSKDRQAAICTYDMVLLNFFRHVSLWIEMHIAISFLLQSVKVSATKRLLWGLRLIWVPSLLLTLCSAFVYPWRYDGRMCGPARWSDSADPPTIADFALCVCICAGSYLTVIYKGQRGLSPSSVQRRASRKAGMYMLNALLTYGPVLFCYTTKKFYSNWNVVTIAWIFELLGGLFNTLTYAWQSRYHRTLVGQSTAVRENPSIVPARPSFTVDFAFGATIIQISEVV